MLSGFIENANIRSFCIFDSLLHSSSVSLHKISLFEIENGVIYRQTGSTWERFGTVKEIALETSNFDSFVKFYDGIDRSVLLHELRTNNLTAYEIIFDSSAEEIDLYYVMKQKSGQSLLVYGYYNNSKKINDIVAISQTLQ